MGTFQTGVLAIIFLYIDSDSAIRIAITVSLLPAIRNAIKDLTAIWQPISKIYFTPPPGHRQDIACSIRQTSSYCNSFAIAIE